MIVRKIIDSFSVRRSRYIAAFLATLMCGFGLGSGIRYFSTFAQSRDKVIEINDVSLDRQQVKIHQPRIGANRLVFGKRFTEKEDWLSRTSFILENTSLKPIVYIRVNVWFPETAKSGQIMVYPLIFGKRPGTRLMTETEEMRLAPSEKLDVTLAAVYEKISSFISERQPIDTISEIKLETSFIVFSDGTAWSVGTFMKADPNDPSRYIPITDKAPEVKNR